MNKMSKNQSDAKAQAQQHFERGKQLWAQGDHGAAMSEYKQALALDPDSPARTALEMANQIMDFYDKNQLNP